VRAREMRGRSRILSTKGEFMLTRGSLEVDISIFFGLVLKVVVLL